MLKHQIRVKYVLSYRCFETKIICKIKAEHVRFTKNSENKPTYLADPLDRGKQQRNQLHHVQNADHPINN